MGSPVIQVPGVAAKPHPPNHRVLTFECEMPNTECLPLATCAKVAIVDTVSAAASSGREDKRHHGKVRGGRRQVLRVSLRGSRMRLRVLTWGSMRLAGTR
jgi:hypothetical protein